jgi:predicted aldo/keto reductase-like oxidoreductase
MKEHRGDFFLATKTDKRTYDGAMRQIESSLKALQTEQVDLLQLHNLVDPAEWETAMGPEGALAAVLDAQDQGLTRYVGVTGHGVSAPAMHARSLERHDFDSVLLPWNYPMAQNSQYAADFEQLLDICAERDVAVQIIKSIAHGGSVSGSSRQYNTWYRPLETQETIDLAVHWVMGLKHVFVITSGDMDLLPMMLEAGSQFRRPSDDSDMQEMAAAEDMQPLFT